MFFHEGNSFHKVGRYRNYYSHCINRGRKESGQIRLPPNGYFMFNDIGDTNKWCRMTQRFICIRNYLLSPHPVPNSCQAKKKKKIQNSRLPWAGKYLLFLEMWKFLFPRIGTFKGKPFPKGISIHGFEISVVGMCRENWDLLICATDICSLSTKCQVVNRKLNKKCSLPPRSSQSSGRIKGSDDRV